MEEPPSQPDLDVDTILHGLNTNQRHAVTSEASILQILAPPGSGKTRTLTSRVAWLLAHGKKPWNIIVATFTVKASKEMKERIGKMIGGGMESKLILGTFHSIARRYIAKYGNLIDIPKGFGIADTSRTQSIISRLIKENKYSTLEGGDAGSVRSRISTLKSKKQTVEEYIALQKQKTNHSDEFAKIYRLYEEELKKNNLLDYDDLLLRCLDLFRKFPSCVSNVEAVLIDEFQDTNLVQFDLMCLLASRRNNITIVGDPDQSIYGFRAAEIGNLATMREVYPETITINLEQNYRSSAAIITCAQEVIEQDKARPNKIMAATHEIGASPVLRQLPNQEAEAKWIVREVARLRALTGNLFRFDDIAILIRSAVLSKAIETQMNNAAVPYRLISGTKFFERQEIKPILDYLRVVQNVNDSDALARCINIPPRGLGPKTIDGLITEAKSRNMTLWTLIRKGTKCEISFRSKIGDKNFKSIQSLVRAITDTQAQLDAVKDAETPDIAPVIQFLLDRIGYKVHVEERLSQPGEERWANVEELIVQAKEYCSGLADGDDEAELPEIDGVDGRKTEEQSKISLALEKFLANAALSSTKDTEGTAEKEEGEGVITVSTIHNAKGLEWPVVFVPGCFEGSIPHSRSDDTDEERRLLYVAMTRAQALLYMSYPGEARGGKGMQEKQESNLSPFLVELSQQAFLGKKGLDITYEDVTMFSKILSRDCPLRSKVEETKALSTLVPLTDEVDSDVTTTWSRYGAVTESYDVDDGYGATRVSLAGNKYQSGYTSYNNPTFSGRGGASVQRTTMTSGGFSMRTTTMQGFQSASRHMTTLETSKLECEADTQTKKQNFKRKSDGISQDKYTVETNKTKEITSKPEKATKKAKAAAKSDGKGTLMNYFKKAPADPAPPPPAPVPVSLPAPPQPFAATSGNSRNQKPEGKPKYILLSSSPERPLPKRLPSSDIINQNNQFKEQMRRNPPSGFTRVSSMLDHDNPSSITSSRAPTTMNKLPLARTVSGLTTTTVSTTSTTYSAYATSSTRTYPLSSSSQSSGVSSAPRRTLGVKRSMNGWNDRHGRK